MVSSSKTEIKDGEEITKGWGKYPQLPITYFVVICFVGLITGSVATARGTDLLGLFIVLLGCAALILLISKNKDSKLRNLILLAFFIRIGLALFHAYIMPLPDSGADALGFENLGWQTAEAWLRRGEVPDLSGAHLYSGWIGVLYFLFGRIPLLAQFTH